MQRFALVSLCFLAFVALALSAQPAKALDAYSSDQQAQFIDWCTGEATNTKSTCSCALERMAVTVPPAALTSFLASESGSGGRSGFSLSTASVTTAALVTEALGQCLK